MDPRPFTEDEVRSQLAGLPKWQLREGRLHRELRFGSFVEAFGFLTSLALIAERMNHHPEIFNVYDRVSLQLWTHDAGGITTLDIQLAHAAEALL